MAKYVDFHINRPVSAVNKCMKMCWIMEVDLLNEKN